MSFFFNTRRHKTVGLNRLHYSASSRRDPLIVHIVSQCSVGLSVELSTPCRRGGS